jgi:putative nucleotidyltransferase with HDIG domain
MKPQTIGGLKDFFSNWSSRDESSVLYGHSLMTARAAGAIAEIIPELDPERAYVSGLFHDVGKFYLAKSRKYKHPRNGYELMKNKNIDLANICISHPFPIFNHFEYIKYYCKNDIEEASSIADILAGISEDDIYVRLIQFCDKVSEPGGYINLSTKFKKYAEKYKASTELISPNHEGLVKVKEMLDCKAGHDVYSVLQDITNTGNPSD